ncbi:MAG: response regulator, partial [Spirochaetales bacterium]|nr:response regulator [Spirochaetales bacterium]
MLESASVVTVKYDSSSNGVIYLKYINIYLEEKMNPKPEILIINNSSDSRSKIKNIIGDLDANIVEAESCQGGLEAVLSGNIDIIISDVWMPRMKGDVLCTILKKDILTQHIPFVLISSSVSQSEMLRGFDSGASAYISKDEAQYVLLNITKDLIEKAALLKQKSVLIVDDSKSILNLVSNNLQSSGFDTLTAVNGDEALQLLSSNDVDIILSDIMMPVLDGFSLCSKVKQSKKWAAIPFIMMSSHSERGFI